VKNDVFAARMNKIERFLSDGRELAGAVARRKHISKSRVKQLGNYRLLFEALRLDPVFARLADHSLRLLHEIIEYVRIYNTLGYVGELSEKAKRISQLLEEYDKLISEVTEKWRSI
jgi:hypothetical protein